MRTLSIRATLAALSFAVLLLVGAACSGGGKSPGTQQGVIVVFTNFQPTLVKIVAAGIAAKGTAAQGANIPVIGLTGSADGTGQVGGSVAQSGGQNENLNLWVQLDGYSDTGDVLFQTDNTNDGTKLQFGLNIQNQPQDNQMNGDLDGTLDLSGDVEGSGLFNLHFVSDLYDDNNDPFPLCTRVTGDVSTASSSTSVDFVLVHATTAMDAAQTTKCAGL